MIKINQDFTSSLIEKARNSERKRTNFNFHTEMNDSLQRMLNVMNNDTYVCPHKHVNPDKREAFILLTGKVLVCEFDENGNISDSIILSKENGSYGCEIKVKSWHTIICLENNSILYEVKDGPYDVTTDKIFATWAPKEGDLDCLDFNRKLIEKFVV